MDKSTFPNERERDLNINDNSLGFLGKAQLTFKRENYCGKRFIGNVISGGKKGWQEVWADRK